MATFSATIPPMARTISICSSCRGFPSMTQLAELGCSRMRGPWNARMVSWWAIPGATTLRPPEYPAMKWGSTRPVTIFRSASRKRLSIRIGIPRRVFPRSAWASRSRAKWFPARMVRNTSSEPMISLSSSPSLGRCNPVATRIWIFSLGTPAPAIVSMRGGSSVPLGTGRVMSQMRTQALFRPRAISESGGDPTGFSSASFTARNGSRTGSIGCLPITVTRRSSGSRTVRAFLPYKRSTFMDGSPAPAVPRGELPRARCVPKNAFYPT